jgi:hypothetical protein
LPSAWSRRSPRQFSYLHIYRLAVQLGQPALAAWLMLLSVDGTVGAASAALLSAARTARERSPWTARVMLALGVLATLGANAYSGSTHGLAGMALAMCPGIAFIGSTETALGMTRRAARTNTETFSDTATVAVLEAPRCRSWTRPRRGHQCGQRSALLGRLSQLSERQQSARQPDITGSELAASWASASAPDGASWPTSRWCRLKRL